MSHRSTSESKIVPMSTTRPTLPDLAALPSLACEPDALSVTYTAGYGAAEDVPAPIRHAILLMVGDMYRFTESAGPGQMASVPMSTTVERLLAPYRRVHL